MDRRRLRAEQTFSMLSFSFSFSSMCSFVYRLFFSPSPSTLNVILPRSVKFSHSDPERNVFSSLPTVFLILRRKLINSRRVFFSSSFFFFFFFLSPKIIIISFFRFFFSFFLLFFSSSSIAVSQRVKVQRRPFKKISKDVRHVR